MLAKLKILFFSGVPIDDTAELYRAGLVAKKLARKDFKVIFTSVSVNFKKIEFRDVAGLPVEFIGQAHYFAQKPFSGRKKLGLVNILIENTKTCFRFAKILRQEKPNKVLLVTTMPISLMIGLTSKILGFKTIIDIDDLVIGQMEAAGYSKFLVKTYGLIEKTLVRIFDKVAVCSHYLQNRYPRSIILPNMVEIENWKSRENRKTMTNIVFVGQIGPYHGQIEILENLLPILRKNPQWQLIFIGEGKRKEKLKVKSQKSKVKSQIVLTGQISQNEVASILATADIGLLPLWDTPVHRARHPLKLLEYLAAGLVVITNDVGEASRIIKDGENGILCPPGDIKCLAKKTEMILANPGLVKKMGQNAIISVKEFSTKKILAKWVKFIS